MNVRRTTARQRGRLIQFVSDFHIVQRLPALFPPSAERGGVAPAGEVRGRELLGREHGAGGDEFAKPVLEG